MARLSSPPQHLGALVLLPLLLAAASGVARADSGMCTSKPPDAGLTSSGGAAASGSGCGGGAASDHEQALHVEAEDDLLHPRLHDISVPLRPGLVLWQSATGIPESFKWLGASMSKGDSFYATVFTINVHTGTHVDAPAHYLKKEWDKGNTVEKLDLEVLVGPALVVHIPSDTNITAEVLQSLDLPGSLTRLLFKTRNSERNLMHQTAFASDYVGLTADGAQWLVDNTDVKLVGIDYVSIASLDHLVTGHEVLLRKHIVPVEGLDLTGLEPGHWYDLTCLPLNIQGAEGAPARCVAFGPQPGDFELEHGSGALEDEHVGTWDEEEEEGGGAPLGSEDEL